MDRDVPIGIHKTEAGSRQLSSLKRAAFILPFRMLEFLELRDFLEFRLAS
jgi:hypothetical protein